MAEVEKARQVLEAERQAVLDELREAAKDREAEAERHRVALLVLSERLRELLMRGHAAGASGADMAEAAGISRQHLYRLARPGEGGDAAKGAKPKPSRKRKRTDEGEHDLGGEA